MTLDEDLRAYLYKNLSAKTSEQEEDASLENARDVSSRFSSTCETEPCWGLMGAVFDEVKKNEWRK